MNLVLYRREIKRSLKLLIIITGILTLYISMIIGMYDPDMSALLKQFETYMPELMSAVGMTGTTDTLGGFMASYLYGMILLMFPMIYEMIRANGLIAKYVDNGSMISLLSAPVKRTKIVFTQYIVLITGIVVLVFYCTVLEFVLAEHLFAGELFLSELIRLNTGLLCLHLFIGSWGFLCSCIFNTTKYSIAFGAGIPVFMYVLQMLANMGEELEIFKYFTFFTLFQPNGLLDNSKNAISYSVILLAGAVIMAALCVIIFRRKDLHL